MGFTLFRYFKLIKYKGFVMGFVFYIGNKVRYMIIYIDKFAPFHYQMSVIHNCTFLSNFYKPYIFIKLKVQGRWMPKLIFNIQDVTYDIWGRKVNFWIKSRKRYWTLIFYCKIIGL